MNCELRFDDVAHRAWLGDRELVRATTALGDVGIVDTRWFTPAACDRGSRVHAAGHALFSAHRAGVLPVQLPPLLDTDEPYFEGLLRFREDAGWQHYDGEQGICDEAEGYAGKYDLFGRFLTLPDDAFDLVDIKTGAVPDWTALQTAGYARRVRVKKQLPFPLRRWALELPGDGTYRLAPLNIGRDGRVDRAADRQHEQVFLAAVRVSRFKRGL